MIAFRASRHNHPRGLDRSFGSNGRQEYNGTCGARFSKSEAHHTRLPNDAIACDQRHRLDEG